MAELHALISAAQSVNGSVGVVAFDGYTITFSMVTSTTPVTYKLTARKGTDVRTITWRDGAKGNTGNGIANAVLNADYTLTLTFTDGTTYTTPSIRGAKGDNGSDASVTAENIATALGYTPADADDVSELSEDIVGKLSEPSSGLAVGKYFRIASIDDSGHAVLEACDAPATDVQINGTSITQDGVANIPYIRGDYHTAGLATTGNGYGIDVGGANNNLLYVSAANNANISGRNTPYKPIVPNNLDYAVKAAMCDGVGVAWTSTEQAAARSRMGIDKEWVLKCTISTESKADIFSVDMAGYTELYIYSTAVATGNGNLYIQGNRPLTQQLYANGTRVSVAYFKDDMLGIAPIYGRLGSAATNLASTLTAAYLLNISVSQITMLKLSHPDLVTSCDIKIYAR